MQIRGPCRVYAQQAMLKCSICTFFVEQIGKRISIFPGRRMLQLVGTLLRIHATNLSDAYTHSFVIIMAQIKTSHCCSVKEHHRSVSSNLQLPP